MNATTTTPARVSAADALSAILSENVHVVDQLRDASPAMLDAAAERLQRAERIFVLGAGRSGLALRMTAMRLMHLGLEVHVVGEVTTPAIADGDVLLVASGSGTTGAIVRAAETASALGVEIVALTTDADSPLGRLAEVTLVIPAAAKQDHGGPLSVQYSGGLFEQSVLFVGDALFHTLWKASGATAEELWPRHANLE
ncbi:3-hexulose-6-phosphate isomerase [Cryobacterium sp. MLB-32]|uniref:6-phospho-3-hexuloisomerase n=1 Tax=Cryobacterium sp. MLB-32 TaxID=1529318 RepID=UPI0004E61E32|nr:6-phospho-3-hexuloisomerase [Cryobacterium sp. MLB-32]KFF59307.1 3-hexulose-6-phosphate isomerase [Cryobacterium sp. MLB-32]